ncbi:hypothetical protein H7H51_25135 [Mycolicibacterium farcinogenes]|nr:hypothetical protein [Mycolicibacterium farcinogenes]
MTETIENGSENTDVVEAVTESVEVEQEHREPVIIDRPIQTVGRRKEAWCGFAWSPAPASSTWTAAPWRTTSRTRCTSS